METAFDISILSPDAEVLLMATHYRWVLDAIFREDASRIRSGDAAQNKVVLRQSPGERKAFFALMTLRKSKAIIVFPLENCEHYKLIADT